MLQGFSYDNWDEDDLSSLHREVTVIAVLARKSTLELASKIHDVLINARSEEHASKLIESLKSLYLIGHDDNKKVEQAKEHAEFLKLMSEGIHITSAGGDGTATGRVVELDRHTLKPIK